MDPFWGKITENEIKLLNNKSQIFINYLSILVPDILFLIKHKFHTSPKLPSISFVNINLIRRLIHVGLWYWGYFYRMKKIVKPNTIYEKLYNLQLITWIGANIFPLTKHGEGISDQIHYTCTSINFAMFSFMKILFCRNSTFFKYALLGLTGSMFTGSGMGLFKRLCVYNVIHTTPHLM